jgi:hypothetical protein
MKFVFAVSLVSFVPLVFTGLFLLVWFFVGNVWVFSVFSKVQTKDPTITATYCASAFYYFCFGTLVAPYILLLIIGILFCFICCCCRTVLVKQC